MSRRQRKARHAASTACSRAAPCRRAPRLSQYQALVTGHDDKAIVNEIEAGEDHIKAKFEAVLGDRELSPGTRQFVESSYASVKAGHDGMRDLKHQLQH